MSHIHEVEVHFRENTENAKKWLEYGLTKDGFRKLSEEAKGGSTRFTDEKGEKYDMRYDEKEGFSVHKHY